MRHTIALFIMIIALSGCRDKVICPAFQSTYILDDSVRLTYYSYLWKLDKGERLKYLASQRPANVDSSTVAAVGNGVDYFAYVEEIMVPPNEVNKSRYGIVKYEPYWLKNYKLKSAPMENVLSPPAEVDPVVEVGEFVASDFSDTINVAGDTTAVALHAAAEPDIVDTFELPTLARASKPKPKKETVYLYRYDPKDEMLNVEQQYYNKHFGQQLYRKVEVAPPATNEEPEETSGGFWDFLKFGKKNTDEPDPFADETPPAQSTPDELADEEPGGTGN